MGFLVAGISTELRPRRGVPALPGAGRRPDRGGHRERARAGGRPGARGGAGGARPGEDAVLPGRQPRAADAAVAHTRSGRERAPRRAPRAGRRECSASSCATRCGCRSSSATCSISREWRPAGRTQCASRRPRRVHRGARSMFRAASERAGLALEVERPDPPGSVPWTGRCGSASCSTWSPTRSSSPSRASIRVSLVREGDGRRSFRWRTRARGSRAGARERVRTVPSCPGCARAHAGRQRDRARAGARSWCACTTGWGPGRGAG